MNTAQQITQQAMENFQSNNRDLLACLKNSCEDVFSRTCAAASLDGETRADLTFFAENIDQEDLYARKVAREDMKKTIYASIAKAFCRLLANGSLRLAMKLTDEADLQQLELRYVSNLEQRPAAEPVVPVLSPAEALEAEVVADYNGALSTDKMKAKMSSNVKYRETYKRLAETNRLESRVTTLHDGAKL